MASELVRTVILALAVSAVSMTVAKASVFAPLRLRVKARSRWLGELVSCPYCLSHWVSVTAVAVYQPRPVTSGVWLLDLAVSVFATVALAAYSSGLIFRAFAPMPE